MRFLTDIHRAWWVYVGMMVPVAETALVVSSSSVPALSWLRILLGLFTLGFLPGFLTVRALFPEVTMPRLETALMSVFLSLVIAVGTGIALGLGPFFLPTNVSFVLTSYSVLCALAAGYRIFSSKRKARGSTRAPKMGAGYNALEAKLFRIFW